MHVKLFFVDEEGKKHLVKSSVMPQDVWNETKIRYFVQFDELNQPLRRGGSILVSFPGDIEKHEVFCPVGVKN